MHEIIKVFFSVDSSVVIEYTAANLWNPSIEQSFFYCHFELVFFHQQWESFVHQAENAISEQIQKANLKKIPWMNAIRSWK